MVHFPQGSKCLLCMKLFGLATTLSAALIMLFDQQTTNFGGYRIHASYKSSSAFRYFVGGNAAAAVSCLVSLPFELKQEKHALVYLLDLMTACLAISATSAATAISVVGKYGNNEIGWTQICQYYGSFCNRGVVAVGLAYVGFLSLLAACAYSFSVQKLRQSKSVGAPFATV